MQGLLQVWTPSSVAVWCQLWWVHSSTGWKPCSYSSSRMYDSLQVCWPWAMVGNMTQAAVAAQHRSWRSTIRSDTRTLCKLVPVWGACDMAIWSKLRRLHQGKHCQQDYPQAASATASMLAWRFGNTILTAKLASHCSWPKALGEIAPAIANMNPRLLGSTMPTAVVALLPCCRKQRHLRVNARTTASTSPKLLGNMTPTVAGALQHWLRPVHWCPTRDAGATASLSALLCGVVIQVAGGCTASLLEEYYAQTPGPLCKLVPVWGACDMAIWSKLRRLHQGKHCQQDYPKLLQLLPVCWRGGLAIQSWLPSLQVIAVDPKL